MKRQKNNRLNPSPKLFDTQRIARGGKIEDHWDPKTYQDVFGNARRGPKVPDEFLRSNQDYALKYFNLRAFEYGNWLNQRDRHQYLMGATVSMLDLAHIVGVKPKQIGLSAKVNLAFGARGTGGTLAHFEPSTWAINITRYGRAVKGRDSGFLSSGGAGSLGHEWAHALDFFLGRYFDKSTPLNFLSHIITDRMRRIGDNRFVIDSRPRSELTRAFFDLMLKIIYEPIPGRKKEYRYNGFYLPLYNAVKDPENGMGEYWIKKHELFARAFEVYLFYKGIKKGIHNPFLKKQKYKAIMYSSREHFNTWEKEMDKVMKLARRFVPEV